MRTLLTPTVLALTALAPGLTAGGEGESLLELPPPHRALVLEDEDARPRIDGILDEEIWTLATPITDLRQVEPIAGADPSQRTEVRFLRSRRAIYIGVLCLDDDPAAIRATQARRDANLDPDDRVEILLDTFQDRRNGFWFQIGAAGSKGDALITRNGSEFNKQWDGIWHGRARVTARGWEAELEIPASTLSFDPAADQWGVNVRRHIRRNSEEARWATPSPRIGFFSVANAGLVGGFAGLEQGLGLDVKPFAVADTRYEDEAGEYDFDLDAGVDAFYRITPDSKLSLSFNTDFAETEADSRRVNLTRFPLFFPEKRDFFLEDSGNFYFGAGRRSRDVLPFFSRRIGIDGDGNEVSLLAAAKMTGRTESYSYGVMDVQTKDAGGLDSRNLAVGRFSKNLFDQSDAGIILTHGNPTGDERSDTYGADFNYRTDRFRGNRNLQFSTFLLRTDVEGVDGDDYAYHVGVSYPNDEIDLSLTHTMVGSDFRPSLGFVPRRGIKKYSGSLSYRPRINGTIRRVGFGFYPSLVTDHGNELETASVTVQPLYVEWESGEELRVMISDRKEVLDEDFEIRDGNVIDADTYDYTRYSAMLETSPKRPLSVQLEFSTGGFYDGRREDYEVQLDWRPSAVASLGLDYEHNAVDLSGGDFRVHVLRTRCDFQFGPGLAWMNYVQWDNQSHFLGLNSRVWWIPRPGQEVFLVMNQGWEADSDGIAPEDGQVIVKVGTTFRF